MNKFSPNIVNLPMCDNYCYWLPAIGGCGSNTMADSRFASNNEAVLLCNGVSHWPGASYRVWDQSERPLGAGFRSVNSAARWREDFRNTDLNPAPWVLSLYKAQQINSCLSGAHGNITLALTSLLPCLMTNCIAHLFQLISVRSLTRRPPCSASCSSRSWLPW